MIKKVLVFTLLSTAQIRWIYADAVYVSNVGWGSVGCRRGGQSIKIQAYSSQCTVSKFRIGLQPTSPLILAKFWSIRLLWCLPWSLVPMWNLGSGTTTFYYPQSFLANCAMPRGHGEAILGTDLACHGGWVLEEVYSGRRLTSGRWANQGA